MATVRVSDLDFVFISYREPNADENYADLLNIVPWAKRVHGVKGFDNAHKAAAERAETDFFISVDGDNRIDPAFLLQTLDWSKTDPRAVHRWRARNVINGLIYGNGGVVGWPKETCLSMKTHENAEDKRAALDFCWTVPHENLHNVYSTTHINHTPEQAFIAGWREGVKMSLDQGKKVEPSRFMQSIWEGNLRNLLVWMSIGADVENGRWAILGARYGCYMSTLDDNYDVELISDLEFMNDKFVRMMTGINANTILNEDIVTYGNSLRQRLGLPLADLDAAESQFYKFCQKPYQNRGVQDRESK
jgi:hypothetical protein